MSALKSKTKFAIGLFIFCCAYWILDSMWSFLSFEKNLSYLIFREPMSYLDTLLLRVSPYQVVSRIMVVVIFIVSGTLIAIGIAKQKKVEEENRFLERQLQQAQKMEAIGTLAGGIAHDFNNILYGAIGFTELCLEDVDRGTLLHDNLSEILASLLRAKELVQQILTFSSSSVSKKRPVQIAPILSEVSKLLRSTLPTTIKIEVDIRTTESTILGDATQIHQVLMNLSTNAAHAMEDKGGTLLMILDAVQMDAAETIHLKLSDLDQRTYIKLSVSDTGIGIPPEHIERIFDPFFTSKETGKGTGMGLAVVHGIVQSHEGRITVKSTQRIGTTFDVYFPKWTQRIPPADHTARKSPPKEDSGAPVA